MSCASPRLEPNICLPKVEGAPWPYFPVDLLPPVVALGTVAEGTMLYWNKVYEGAFGWIPELMKSARRSPSVIHTASS